MRCGLSGGLGGAGVVVECNDDDAFCSAGSGVTQVPDVTCGETLWIRVSGVDGGTGTAGIQISCFGGDCPCTGDLNGDGIVDGADFGLLLSGFGACPKKGDCPEDLDGNGVADACEAADLPGDLNGDGLVNGEDLGLFLVGWGQPGPTDFNGDGTTNGIDLINKNNTR